MFWKATQAQDDTSPDQENLTPDTEWQENANEDQEELTPEIDDDSELAQEPSVSEPPQIGGGSFVVISPKPKIKYIPSLERSVKFQRMEKKNKRGEIEKVRGQFVTSEQVLADALKELGHKVTKS